MLKKIKFSLLAGCIVLIINAASALANLSQSAWQSSVISPDMIKYFDMTISTQNTPYIAYSIYGMFAKDLKNANEIHVGYFKDGKFSNIFSNAPYSRGYNVKIAVSPTNGTPYLFADFLNAKNQYEGRVLKYDERANQWEILGGNGKQALFNMGQQGSAGNINAIAVNSEGVVYIAYEKSDHVPNGEIPPLMIKYFDVKTHLWKTISHKGLFKKEGQIAPSISKGIGSLELKFDQNDTLYIALNETNSTGWERLIVGHYLADENCWALDVNGGNTLVLSGMASFGQIDFSADNSLYMLFTDTDNGSDYLNVYKKVGPGDTASDWQYLNSNQQIQNPYFPDMVIDKQNNIIYFVARGENTHNNEYTSPTIIGFDAQDGTEIYKKTFKAFNEVNNKIAVDGNGNLYLLDYDNRGLILRYQTAH
ncbi:MAG: hypothetical protein AAGA27_00065 [Pseudomonadota bacterium]